MRHRLFEIGFQRKGPWEHLVGKRRLKLGNKSPSKGRATRLAQPGIGTLRKCEVHNNGKPGQLVIFCVEFVRVQFLAVQDSSIGDFVTHSLTHSLTH